MTPKCDCCAERIDQLNQQVSVMRKEIKNLRQMLDTATRTHRKHMLAIQSAVSKTAASKPTAATAPSEPPPAASASSGPPPAASTASSGPPQPAAAASSGPPQPAAAASSGPPQPAAAASSGPPQPAAAASASLQHIVLEQGNIQTVPIGYISSCFSLKNGTPRQPTICGPSRAELRIKHSVFNNPEHALVGLEQYSHVWIIFLFHKNGHLKYKAKVKPPRLNGQRVGVYSTRSPHRPNVLGLTLAKLDRIVGDTIHLSDVDMIAGTPVLDIKPYIPEYDSPHARKIMDFETCQPKASTYASTNMLNLHCSSETDILSNSEGEVSDDGDHRSHTPRDRSEGDTPHKDSSEPALPLTLPDDTHVLEEVKAYVNQSDLCQLPSDPTSEALDSKTTEPQDAMEEQPSYGEGACSTIAGWIRAPPVGSLEVRFTPHAEKELGEFLPAVLSGLPGSKRPRFKFLRSSEEAAAAIRGVLSADPRSVYRRNRCKDKLFFFTLDTADITCWFGQGFAEVLQVRPVERPFASM